MRLFMFTSQAKDDLHAFAGDESGSKLPAKYGPWGLTGTLNSRETPPHQILAQDHRAVDLDGGLPALAHETQGLKIQLPYFRAPMAGLFLTLGGKPSLYRACLTRGSSPVPGAE